MKDRADELRSLMIASRRGDERSARRLHSLTAPALHGCARVLLRDEQLACDAVQSVYLKILSLPVRTLRKIDEPLPWLVTLARNEARSMLRSRGRAEKRERENRNSNDPGPSALSGDALRDAIGALPDELAELVVLKHAGGLTFDEISIALAMNRNTAASRYREALGLLRERLAGAGQPNTMEATDAR